MFRFQLRHLLVFIKTSCFLLHFDIGRILQLLIFFSQAQYISKLVKIAGITIAASRTKAKATYVTLICKNCKKGKQVPCRPGLGGAVVPRSCDHIPQV